MYIQNSNFLDFITFIVKLLSDHDNPLSAIDIERIAIETKGYSGRYVVNKMYRNNPLLS